MTDKDKDKLIYDILFSDIEDFEVELCSFLNIKRVEFRSDIKFVIQKAGYDIIKDSVTTITSGPLWKFSIKR